MAGYRVKMGCGFAAFLFLAFLVLGSGSVFLFQAPFWLLFGWVFFLYDALGRIMLQWSMLLTFAFCMGGFMLGMHYFGAWLHGTLTVSRGARQAWSLRWTLSLAVLVILLFAAGIACIDVFHQSAWMATSSEPLVGYGWRRYDDISLDAKDLKYRAVSEQWSTTRLQAYARHILAFSEGKKHWVVATGADGEWNALITIQGVPEGEQPIGTVLKIDTRFASEAGLTELSLTDLLEYCAKIEGSNLPN